MRSLLTWLIGLAVDLFYRRVSTGQHSVPRRGPVLLVANHPHRLVDPAVIIRSTPRRVRLLAKAPLFRGWLAPIMRSLGAVPVHRKEDGGDTRKNDAAFRAVEHHLRRGACVLVFPEGRSHDEPELLPLKTGAARMAFAAESSAGWQLGVTVVPVGLVYEDKERFRSEVATVVGAPIVVRERRAAFEADAEAAVRALTADIEAALARVTLTLEPANAAA